MSARKRNNKWWVDFHFNRTRYRKPSPENTRNGAQAYEIHLRQKLARGEPLERMGEVKKIVLFIEFAETWFHDYVEVNNKLSEQRTKRSILTTHLTPYFGKMALSEITRHGIDVFKAIKQRNGLNHKTINNILNVLSRLLKTAEEWDLIKSCPRFNYLKVAPSKFDYLSKAECELLLRNADGIIKDMILLVWHTGLRFGEIIALTWSDIDFDKGTININKAVARGQLGTTKSYKSRLSFLTADVRKMLMERKCDKRHSLIFPNGKGNFLIQSRCLEWLHGLCEKAGLRKIGWHTFRHTFASHLVEGGYSLRTVQELLGHSDPKTTMRYAHLSPSVLKETVKIFDKLSSTDYGFCHNSVTAHNHERFNNPPGLRHASQDSAKDNTKAGL